jgi:predicted phosphodiesterase
MKLSALPTLALCLLGAVASGTRVSGESGLSHSAPAWFGSRPEVRERITAGREGRYSFAVLGDIQQGLRTFRRTLERVKRDPAVAFSVACGDLVNNGTEPHYRLLFDAARTAGSRIPVLTVPGNHDDPANYQRLVGPTSWVLRLGPDLLLGVDDAWGPVPATELERLARVLSERDYRHRFVFLHRPVFRDGALRPGFGPLLRVLEAGGVDAVVAGHTHVYERRVLRGVLHLSNGLGGDLSSDTEDRAWLTMFHVGPQGFADRRIAIEPSLEIASHVRDALVAHLYAPLRSSGLWEPLAAALLAIALALGSKAWGEAGVLPLVALFVPAFASPPPAAFLLAGDLLLVLAVAISLADPRLSRPSRWVALAGLLLLARSPWLLAGVLPVLLALHLRRRGAGVLLRPGFATGSILLALLLVGLWTGPAALSAAPAGAALILPAVWVTRGGMR